MDTTQQRSLPPVAALIGALLALEGIRDVLQLLLGALGNRLYQSQGSMDWFLHQISRDPHWWLKLLIGVLFMTAGLGLLRGARWARLGAMAVLALDIAFQLVAFLWPYGAQLFATLHPFAWLWLALPRFFMLFLSTLLGLATSLAMLLFLALPTVRDTWQDQRNASLGLLDRWGAAIERRLPAGLPLVAAFIAVYLICLGLPIIYSNITSLPVFWGETRPMSGLMYLFLTISLVIALGLIVAGVALLRRAAWAKTTALLVLGLLAFELLFLAAFGLIMFFTGSQHGQSFGAASMIMLVISNAVTFLISVATYFILAVSLVRALKPGLEMQEAAEA